MPPSIPHATLLPFVPPMDIDLTIDLEHVARELELPGEHVRRTVELLDEGNTVPFITRYRKDRTGGLDENQIRGIQDKVGRLRTLAERKQTILKSIESQGKLTDQLAELIRTTHSPKRLEDLYLPYKPKKQTLANLARQRGLKPLAQQVLRADPAIDDLHSWAAGFVDAEKSLTTSDEVLLGIKHLLAESFSEQAELRSRLRKILRRTGKLVSKAVPTVEKPAQAVAAGQSEGALEENLPEQSPPAVTEPSIPHTDDADPRTASSAVAVAEEPTPPANPKQTKQKSKITKKQKKQQQLEIAFKDYFDFQEPLSRLPPHRVLAINRGERAKMLRVKVEADLDAMRRETEQLLLPDDHPHLDYLRDCAGDALTRLMFPSLEREARRELTERAEAHALQVFVRNLRKLLLQPPVHGHRVLAVDPGFRSGCKLVALDEFGNVLGHGVIHLIGSEERRRRDRARMAEMIKLHHLSVLAVGNGTGCRETEQLACDLIADELKDQDVAYVIVNEAGASVYSTSDVGREELPDYDATLRGAISIGRRLLDPLSELVKINPANIGVGLYQHDVKAKHLRSSLDDVVESCVNYVGVDVNTASPALLRYVSGLNETTARRLYEHRRQHGPLANREQLKEVPGLGEATFVQAAGFLKITGGDNPLDSTWIHPESYEAARRVVQKLGDRISDFPSSGELPKDAKPAEVDVPSAAAAVSEPAAQRLAPGTEQEDVARLSGELQIGALLLGDILASLARPGRDPREDLPPPVFRRAVMKLEDLQVGMELTGTVLNVVDFGAFVDIGLHNSGLVHISRLADRYVRDPHDVVGVGDILKVWVIQIDKTRRRVSLTAVKPGTEKPYSAGRDKQGAGHAKKPSSSTTTKRPTARRPYKDKARSTPDKKGKFSGPYRPKPQAKPVVRITKKMEQGKEPMRTFSDLKQLFDKKNQDEEKESE